MSYSSHLHHAHLSSPRTQRPLAHSIRNRHILPPCQIFTDEKIVSGTGAPFRAPSPQCAGIFVKFTPLAYRNGEAGAPLLLPPGAWIGWDDMSPGAYFPVPREVHPVPYPAADARDEVIAQQEIALISPPVLHAIHLPGEDPVTCQASPSPRTIVRYPGTES